MYIINTDTLRGICSSFHFKQLSHSITVSIFNISGIIWQKHKMMLWPRDPLSLKIWHTLSRSVLILFTFFEDLDLKNHCAYVDRSRDLKFEMNIQKFMLYHMLPNIKHVWSWHGCYSHSFIGGQKWDIVIEGVNRIKTLRKKIISSVWVEIFSWNLKWTSLDDDTTPS